MASPRTLLEAIQHFSDVDVATQFFASLRWPDGPICPRCECTEYSYLKTRRLWKCRSCKYQYSVKKGLDLRGQPDSAHEVATCRVAHRQLQKRDQLMRACEVLDRV